MVRQKGTLTNFKGDGVITGDAIRWCLHTGKVPVGQEGKLLIERRQLEAWGLIKEVIS
jgi:hypothetical protein